jgi:hypothetical protein
MEYTLSLSHVRQMEMSFSVKNYSPSYLASAGYYSTTESLIRQFLSSLKSFRAGTMDCYRFSRPMTWFNDSSLLNRFNLTSLDSSRSKARNIGSICSLVGPFSIIGQIERMFSARAYLT